MTRVVVLGAGGHGKVLAYVLRLGGHEVVGFTDDDEALHGRQVLGLQVLGPNDRVPELPIEAAIVGIGNNRWRRAWYERLLSYGVPLANAVHPTALLAQGVVLGQGVAILANVSVNVEAAIGSNVILNTSALVGHDCQIQDHAHVGPGAVLCGAVRVGREACLGAAAVVIPECTIGEGSVVGAGTVVLRDTPDHSVVVGNPGRVIRRTGENAPAI
jgi:sugar O-acyltransferase (sialic acid O-acetyltransferase NeuD family)